MAVELFAAAALYVDILNKLLVAIEPESIKLFDSLAADELDPEANS